MTESMIEWTGRSDWNPIRGCTRVSPGCGGPGPHGGCYAEAIAGRFSDPDQAFHGFAKRTPAGGRWTGKVEIMYDRLLLPLSWRKPALIFATSTSDLFHEALSVEQIAQVYAVAVAGHHLRGHRTQFLTKRPERARDVMNDELFWDIVNGEASMHVMDRVDPLDRRSDDARATLDDYDADDPPPGIWMGVSVEDQQRADERRDAFRQVPAVIRFVSYEPALGPVDWEGWEFVSQIISGGESGPRARPNHPDWHRDTRDFCAEHGLAYFFKQWGCWAPGENIGRVQKRTEQGAHWDDGKWSFESITPRIAQELHSDDAPDVWRTNKKDAGRLLDGVEHSEIPA